MKKKTKQKEKSRSEELSPRYFVDARLLEERGRSFTSLLAQCACDEHSRAISGSSSHGKGAKSPMAIIASCCSKKPGYLTARTPTLEAVFKVLVANQNQPMSASELSQSIVIGGVGNNGLRDLSPELISRIVERDEFYGFTVKLPQLAKSGS